MPATPLQYHERKMRLQIGAQSAPYAAYCSVALESKKKLFESPAESTRVPITEAIGAGQGYGPDGGGRGQGAASRSRGWPGAAHAARARVHI